MFSSSQSLFLKSNYIAFIQFVLVPTVIISRAAQIFQNSMNISSAGHTGQGLKSNNWLFNHSFLGSGTKKVTVAEGH